MEDTRTEAEAIARRQALSAEIAAETGIDDAMIARLVHGFYDRARADAVLGPVFEARITDWPAHLTRMCAFWSSVALMTGRYHGTPMRTHAPLPVDAEHFDRWLALFQQTATDLCPPAAAEHFIARARMIAQSLEMGVAQYQGMQLGKGERLRRRDAAKTE